MTERGRMVIKKRRLMSLFICDKWGNIIPGYPWNQIIREEIEKTEKIINNKLSK